VAGRRDTPDETLFAAIVYVLVSGCAWRALPPCFGISKSTAHCRFVIWSRAGVWGRLHEEIVYCLDNAGLLDLTRVVLDSAHVRAKRAFCPAGCAWFGLQVSRQFGVDSWVSRRLMRPIMGRWIMASERWERVS
jgi:Putative transposase of IS4/5 family (DUF4096)